MNTGSNNQVELIFDSPGVFPDVPLTISQNKPNFHRDKALRSREGINDVLSDLFEVTPEEEFHSKDVALLNLLCSPSIKGAENLDIPRHLNWLDGLTGRVRGVIEKNVYRFRDDPEYGDCLPKWKMGMLVTVLKRSYGAAYNPVIAAACESGQKTPMDNARDVFLNGLLDENRRHRHGTCASIPVLIASIGRRLGYPIKLAVAGRHIFARWDGDGLRFNIEATGPMGMVIKSDEKYREEHIPEEFKISTYFIRNLTAAEEFALFLTFRVECLVYADRYDDTLRCSARALQFAPEDQSFLHWACRGLNTAMRRRFKKANPTVHLPPVDAPGGLDFNVGPLLHKSERADYLTIIAHLDERDGKLPEARGRYEQACRENFHGLNEHRDLQRFLKKYNLPRTARPLMPPETFPSVRRVTLRCRPDEEAILLRQMANHHYRKGDYVKSHGALHDLYMFDPGDAEVFQATRKLYAMPEFQTQLKAAIAEQQRRQKN